MTSCGWVSVEVDLSVNEMNRVVSFRLFLLMLMITARPAAAQQSFDAVTGIGYYELFHVGFSWKYSSKSAIGVYAGTNFNRKDEKISGIGLTYSHIYIKPLVWKVRPGFSLKPHYWTQDDVNYHFSNIALLLQGTLNYPVSDKLNLYLEGGCVFNYVLETERKQNTTAGSPARWNGNMAFSVSYRLSK